MPHISFKGKEFISFDNFNWDNCCCTCSNDAGLPLGLFLNSVAENTFSGRSLIFKRILVGTSACEYNFIESLIIFV